MAHQVRIVDGCILRRYPRHGLTGSRFAVPSRQIYGLARLLDK